MIGHEEGNMENARNSKNMETNIGTLEHENKRTKEYVNETTTKTRELANIGAMEYRNYMI